MKGAAGGRTAGGRLTRSRAVRWGAGGTAATRATLGWVASAAAAIAGGTATGRLMSNWAARWNMAATAITAITATTPPTRSRVASAGSAAVAATVSAATWVDGRLPATTVRTTP